MLHWQNWQFDLHVLYNNNVNDVVLPYLFWYCSGRTTMRVLCSTGEEVESNSVRSEGNWEVVVYRSDPGVAFCTAELKKASLKKSREPLKTTRALFLAWRPAIRRVFLPTAWGYWHLKKKEKMLWWMFQGKIVFYLSCEHDVSLCARSLAPLNMHTLASW